MGALGQGLELLPRASGRRRLQEQSAGQAGGSSEGHRSNSGGIAVGFILPRPSASTSADEGFRFVSFRFVDRLDLNESVHKLQQMAKEGEAFVRSEYRSNKTNDQHEDRTLTISAAEFASGLASIHKMYQRTNKVKQAAYDLISEGSDASERDQLCALFVSPPCFDSKCIQDLLAKGLA
mmetsp:Transcript_8577/g.22125  ORF Transcript_8577/g.22125 Transcript_8577/m.22125 type:complete len:179 (+) Transcript_8577:216-752(+)